MDPRSLPIERLIPHRGQMCWLQRLLDADEISASVEAQIDDEHPLADVEGVPAWAGIEYMAQAIAAWAGTRALARGEAARPGFLLGTRHYECSIAHFARGAVLRIEARCELFGDNGLGLFACRILIGDETVAHANVSVFEPPDPAAFLENPAP